MTATMLETIDGTLVHAQIGPVILDREPVDGAVILQVNEVAVKLPLDQVRAIAHALSCAVTPYGWPTHVDEPPC